MAENRYFKARKSAAEFDKRLRSREGASELLGVSVSSMSAYELGTVKSVPVDIVVMMADLYNAPELLNHYCATECPIGKSREIVTERGTLEGMAVRLACALDTRELEEVKRRVLMAAADGRLSLEEAAELDYVTDLLNRIDAVRQELELHLKGAR